MVKMGFARQAFCRGSLTSVTRRQPGTRTEQVLRLTRPAQAFLNTSPLRFDNVKFRNLVLIRS
jgi:hypothetical protein